MTTLEWILIGYIVYSNLMLTTFVNSPRRIRRKWWFQIPMCISSPIAFIVLFIQVMLEELKERK